MPPFQSIENNDNHTTPAIVGGMASDYNDLNKSQSTVWRFAKPLFAKAMQGLLAPSSDHANNNNNNNNNTPFRVADLGCATGGNSIAPLSFISSQLRNANQNVSLEVFLGDLPSTAWGSLVQTVTPASITANHPSASSNTFVYMVGRSFYECCAPPGSMDLVYSLVAVHWMKSYAGDLPSGLFATDPLHVPEPHLLKAWCSAGQRDWHDFVHARHQELKLGGQLIVAAAAPKINAEYPWCEVGKALYDALRTKVSGDPNVVLASCIIPCCWRTEDEIRAGFTSNCGWWGVEACEFHQTKDPVREALERGELTPLEYARSVMESFKAVCHLTCVNSLAKSMSQQQAEQLLWEAYNDCMGTIALDPEQYNLDVAFWYILATKTAP